MDKSALAIRETLQALPGLAVASTGAPPAEDDIFFPDGHAEVLDPDVSLVIGNRGMGKSFWALALADASLRRFIGGRYQRLRKWRLDSLDAGLGFADAEGVRGVVSRAELESVALIADPVNVWRAIYIRALGAHVERRVPKRLPALGKV